MTLFGCLYQLGRLLCNLRTGLVLSCSLKEETPLVYP